MTFHLPPPSSNLHVTGGSYFQCIPATSGISILNFNNTGFNDPAILPQWGNSAWLGHASNYFFKGYISDLYTQFGHVTTSDGRLKTNVQPIAYGLKTVLQLKPVVYDFAPVMNEGMSAERKQYLLERGKNNLGFIAQELQTVVPNSVVYNQVEDTYGVNYQSLIPVLVKAIQEQQAQIDSLQQAILNLQNK